VKHKDLEVKLYKHVKSVIGGLCATKYVLTNYDTQHRSATVDKTAGIFTEHIWKPYAESQA